MLSESMDRVTVRFPEQQIEELERLVEVGVFPSRSEAIRWAVHQQLADRSDGENRSRDANATTL